MSEQTESEAMGEQLDNMRVDEAAQPAVPPEQHQATTPAPEVSAVDAEERTKRLIAVVIATAAIIGALLALVRADAGARADEFKRMQKRLTLEAGAQKQGSQVELGFNLSAAQAWLEMAKLTNTAEKRGALSLPNWENFNYSENQWPESVATVVPADWYRPARDRLEEVAPLLQQPYSGDVRRYYADMSLVRATKLSEEATDVRRQQDQWADKSSTYAFYLAILAIGGALLGLSSTMRAKARLICFSTGVGIALTVVALTVSVYVRDTTHLAQSAIDEYAEGVGIAYRGQTANSQVAEGLTRQAVAAFDRALSVAPDYANALFERASALYFLKEYAQAADSYRKAIAAGRNDTGALWNLGWNLYMVGDFEEANQAYRQALDANPDLVTVRMNLALSLLASGGVNDAAIAYEEALQRGEAQARTARSGGAQVPYSFWKQLDRSAADLDALQAAIEGDVQPWMEAPPRDKIVGSDAIMSEIGSLASRIREANVAFEYGGAFPISNRSAGTISEFQYSAPGGRGPDQVYPSTPFEAGMLIDLSGKSLIPAVGASSNTYSTEYGASFNQPVLTFDPNYGVQFAYVSVMFDYANLEDGKPVIWKVYRDGAEDSSLRWQETWHNGPEGHAVKQIDFVFVAAGVYRVEMYYDWRLAQVGEFKIEPR